MQSAPFTNRSPQDIKNSGAARHPLKPFTGFISASTRRTRNAWHLYAVASLMLALIFSIFSTQTASAALTGTSINSVSPNPVVVGQNVTVSVKATGGGAGNENWGSTQYIWSGPANISSCSPDPSTVEATSTGVDRNVTIPAPDVPGTYTLQVRARENDSNCGGGGGGGTTYSAPVTVTVVNEKSNPNIVPVCGLDIILVLDESGSVSSSAQDVRDAAYAFLQGVKGTGSQVAMVEFSSQARRVYDFQIVNNATLADMYNYLNNQPNNSIGNQSYVPGGFTNWDAALGEVKALNDTPGYSYAPLVVFITDGDPTTYGDGSETSTQGTGSPGGVYTTQTQRITNAVARANEVKNQGSHILAIGVGTGLTSNFSLNRLMQITDPQVYPDNVATLDLATTDVIRESDFTKLPQLLKDIVTALCAPSVTITKLVDPGTNVYAPAQGWQFSATAHHPQPDGENFTWVLPYAAAPDQPVSGSTNANGTLGFQLDAGSNGLSTFEITETQKDGYSFQGVTCTLNSGSSPLGTITTSGTTFTVPNVAHDAIVTCEVRNQKIINPAIAISKTPDSQQILVGGTANFNISVTNIGDVPLSNVVVTDALCTTPVSFNGGDTDGDTLLDLNETWQYTCSTANVQDDFVNTAVVNAKDPYGQAVTPKQDTANVYVNKPSLSIEKTATLEFATAAGQIINYVITVKNTGNVDLTNVVLTDEFASATLVSGDNGNSILETTETWTYNASHQVTQAEMNAGTDLVNVAIVDTDQTDPKQDDVTTKITQNPKLSVVKSSTTTELTAPGTVNYSYLVKNIGNIDLTGIVLTDNNDNDDMFCPATSLIVNAEMTCSATHTFTQAELNAGGTLDNIVVAESDQAPDATDDLSIPITQNPKLSVVKSSTTTELTAPGTVNYSYLVKNIGNIDLTGIVLSDNNDNDDMFCPATSLIVNAEMTCSATHTFTQAELDAGGTLDNIVVAESDQAPDATDDLSIPIKRDPKLAITKVAEQSSYDEVGDVITYTIVATNTGNVTLFNVVVVDGQVSDLVCSSNGDVLAPGGTITCTATHSVEQNDLTTGSYANTACVDDGEGNAPQACDDVVVPAVQKPLLIIDKTGTAGPVTIGDTVLYTITVKNNGNVPMTNVTVNDAKLNLVKVFPTLAAGETVQITGSYGPITESDIPGPIFNTAVATGTAPIDTPVGPVTDTHEVPVQINPALTIDKTGTAGPVDIGDTVLYTITVKNSGNVMLTNVTVSDAKLNLVKVFPTLAAGETVQITGSYGPVTESDLPGPIFNTATATGTSPINTPVGPVTDNHETPVQFSPALTLLKSASPTTFTAVGDIISYSYRLTNTGDVTLFGPFTVVDDKTTVTCPAVPASLAVGESIVCTATYSITADDYQVGFVTNVAKGNGKDPNGTDTPSTIDEETVTKQDLPGSIGDKVWFDQNQNGIQDANESGVAGVTVNLYRVGVAAPIATTTTDANGNYLFTDQLEGEYYVEFLAPAGYNYTKFAVAGSQAENDSNAEMPTLLLSVSDGNKEGEFDQNLLYTINYSNSDAARQANSVVLTTTVPAGTTFVADQSSAGWSCTSATQGSVCTFNVGTLAPSATGTLNFTVKLFPREQGAAVPEILDLIVNLVQSNVARTPNFTLPNGGVNLTIDAGLIRSQASDQTPTPADTTGLPVDAQPNQEWLDLFLPTLHTSNTK